ncbi:hypothetical protein [Devosia sp. A369]
MTFIEATNRSHPGDRLVRMIWQMALTSGGKLPTPTVARVNAIKRLSAGWQAEDVAEVAALHDA